MTKSLSAELLDGVAPPSIAISPSTRSNSWEDVSDLSASLGMPLDEWQDIVLEHAMGERANGKWASKFVGVSVSRQNGKALDVETPILTANRGFVRMGDIVVGDYVFHPSGRPTRVVAVTDVMRDRPCYRVATVDGRSVIADAEHDWTVTDLRRERTRKGPDGRRVRYFEPVTMTTADMLAAGLSRYASGGRTSVTSGKTYATNEFRFRLPDVLPLESGDAELPIDPYLFGAWLGDGTSQGGSLTTSAEDLPHWMDVVTTCGFIPTVKAHAGGRAHRVGVTCSAGQGRHTRSFVGALTRLGVRNNKHVPDAYLTASATQREALLQGLMDTDGSISAKGQVEFCSTSPRLADGALFLARSLGWRATIREGRATLNGKDCGTKYRVFFTPKTTDPFRPFRMERKANRVGSLDGRRGRSALSVASIEPVLSVPVRCIQVASADGLYLAGEGLMPTHNSQLIVARALAGVLLFGEKQIIISAHETDTARQVWKRMLDVIEANPSVEARVSHRMDAVNRESISFGVGLDRQTITLKARGKSGSRGFSADCLLIDEGQILGKAAWGSIVPTMSAREKVTPGGPQLWLFGTPPTADDDSFAFTRVRKSARAGKARHTWLEWAAQDGDDPNSPTTWAKANPSYGVRLTEEACADDRAAMDDDQFWLERLGRWLDDAAAAESIIPMDVFGSLLVDETSQIIGPIAVGVDVTPKRNHASVAIAGLTLEGRPQVEIVAHGPGTAWVADVVETLVRAHDPVAVVIDKYAAGAVEESLTAHGVEPALTSPGELGQACAGFYDDAMAGALAHLGDPVLSDALRDSTTRDMGGGASWAWDRRGKTHITPLVAATLARYGVMKYMPAPKAAPVAPRIIAGSPSPTADGVMTAGF